MTVTVADLLKVLGPLKLDAELDGEASWEGGILTLKVNASQAVPLEPLEVVHHVSSGDLNDHDDIDMSDWETNPGCRRYYMHALSEGEDPVKEFGELVGSLSLDFENRHSFELNRDPISRDEAEKAVADYQAG
jgi:hypothetical protein